MSLFNLNLHFLKDRMYDYINTNSTQRIFLSSLQKLGLGKLIFDESLLGFWSAESSRLFCVASFFIQLHHTVSQELEMAWSVSQCVFAGKRHSYAFYHFKEVWGNHRDEPEGTQNH